MTIFTNVRRQGMIQVFSGGARAVVTANAIAGYVYVVEVGR